MRYFDCTEKVSVSTSPPRPTPGISTGSHTGSAPSSIYPSSFHTQDVGCGKRQGNTSVVVSQRRLMSSASWIATSSLSVSNSSTRSACPDRETMPHPITNPSCNDRHSFQAGTAQADTAWSVEQAPRTRRALTHPTKARLDWIVHRFPAQLHSRASRPPVRDDTLREILAAERLAAMEGVSLAAVSGRHVPIQDLPSLRAIRHLRGRRKHTRLPSGGSLTFTAASFSFEMALAEASTLFRSSRMSFVPA